MAKILTPFDLSEDSQLINVAGTSPSATDMRGEGVIGAQREWGVLEYNALIKITPGSGIKLITPFDLSADCQLINVVGTSPTTVDLRGTGVIGTQREWGALEYDTTLAIRLEGITEILTADDALRANSAIPDTNYGTNNEMRVGETNAAVGVSRTWLRFDGLSDGTIPADATIVSAILELYSYADLSDNARTFRVFRPKRAWTEGGLTYNDYNAGAWSTAGGFHVNDCEQVDIGFRNMSSSESNGFKAWALTPAKIQEYVSGIWTDNGFMVKADTELNDAYRYRSNDYATVAQRPKLTVVYTLPGPPGVKSVNETLSENIKSMNEINWGDIKALQGLS